MNDEREIKELYQEEKNPGEIEYITSMECNDEIIYWTTHAPSHRNITMYSAFTHPFIQRTTLSKIVLPVNQAQRLVVHHDESKSGLILNFETTLAHQHYLKAYTFKAESYSNLDGLVKQQDMFIGKNVSSKVTGSARLGDTLYVSIHEIGLFAAKISQANGQEEIGSLAFAYGEEDVYGIALYSENMLDSASWLTASLLAILLILIS